MLNRVFLLTGGVCLIAATLPAPVFAGADDVVRLYQPHDGSFETGFSFAENEEVQFVQWFIFPSENGRLLAFEACFFSYAGDVPGFEYEFQYFSGGPEGENAEPQSFRESFEAPRGGLL